MAPGEAEKAAKSAPQGERGWRQRGIEKRRSEHGRVLARIDWSRGNEDAAIGED